MIFHVRTGARGSGRTFFRAFAVVSLFGAASLGLNGQTSPNCIDSVPSPSQVASTGLSEQIGDVVVICTGGTSGLTALGALYVTLNTNITNTLDANGLPTNIVFTTSGALVASGTPGLTSASTLQIPGISYVVPTPSSTPVTLRISGIRASVASIQNGTLPTQVSVSLIAPGFGLASSQLLAAAGVASVLSSAINNGISCNGSALPSTIDFPGFVAAQTSSSAVRVTEAVPNAFLPKTGAATQGARIIVNLSGYGTDVRLFVPDAIIGNSGSAQTSGGQFSTGVSGGSYAPLANQLLLSRVSGADQNGGGGTLVVSLPGAGAAFTSVSELTVSGGSAYAVYEVLDDNSSIDESFQVPVFIVNAPGHCATTLQTNLSAMLAPVSNVSVATAADPVPRYIASPLASDCQQTGDCAAPYFPVLTISSDPVTLTGTALGSVQQVVIPITNSGGSQLNLAISIAYSSGSGWLTATPTANGNGLALTLAASPVALQQGAYNATVTINGGTAGTATIPVTFNVGPEGVTIQALVSAASYQGGAIAPGSYVALFGLDLAGTSGTGTNPSVTFNGLSASVIYASATQINLIVPSSLSGQPSATVQVVVAGQTSNSFRVSLSPNVPGIFTPGIVNSDGLINSSSNPAVRGSFVQVYLTGLAIPVVAGSVGVNIGSQNGIVPLFAGAQPTYPALDQVNVTIPASLALTGSSVPMAVCVTPLPGTQPICSNSVNLYVK